MHPPVDVPGHRIAVRQRKALLPSFLCFPVVHKISLDILSHAKQKHTWFSQSLRMEEKIGNYWLQIDVKIICRLLDCMDVIGV